ncbi:hypothetical protein AAMO2058_001604600 [Amorphochlora amoebiformis]|uniref:UDP-N-acetylglucosamine--peptide N-acetylglucosaminyltransferase SPINDLY n=1 Tax=Amorphochlora amoebiformis TaxID=1561963 RepID=A0A7S0DH73_9EUKA|mmetsp:Transcript_2815/g.4267  ORF Transcript_2815/g.4267 Transcript_2815/m.4267 type:complete len:270 (+) Transcript_2815:35-844(+)
MQRVIFTPGVQVLRSQEEVKKRQRRVSQVRGLMYKAEGLVREKKYNEAIDCYDSAMKMEKSLITIVTGKAHAQILAGNLNGAIESYNRAMKMSPNNATVLFNRGVVYQKMENFEDAVKDYVRAAEILPRNFKAHYNCALALKKLGMYDQALEQIKSALEYNPRCGDSMYNKANILVKLREYHLAIETLKEAAKIAPEDSGIKKRLGEILEEKKDWDRMEPERRNEREKKYGKKSQLHGYFNRKNNKPLTQTSTTIKVCKLGGNTTTPAP